MFLSVQYLRGLAALLVVFHHLLVQLERQGYAGWWPHFLPAGVDMFFVVSGFIMWVTTEQRPVTPVQFFLRRFARIAPLYWIFTLVILTAAMFMPSVVQSAKLDSLHAITSFLFLPYPSPVDGGLRPLLVAGWTLNYEMLFYLLFGACLLLAPSRRLVAICLILICLPLFGLLTQPSAPMVAFWTSTILLEFLLGVMIGWAMNKVPGSKIGGLSVLALGVCALVAIGLVYAPADEERVLFFGIPAALVVAGAVLAEKAGVVGEWRLPKLLGDASYSLYLSHGLVLSAAGQAWRRLPIDQGPIALATFSVIAVISASIVGILIYRYVELPIHRRSLRLLNTRGAVTT